MGDSEAEAAGKVEQVIFLGAGASAGDIPPLQGGVIWKATTPRRQPETIEAPELIPTVCPRFLRKPNACSPAGTIIAFSGLSNNEQTFAPAETATNSPIG